MTNPMMNSSESCGMSANLHSNQRPVLSGSSKTRDRRRAGSGSTKAEWPSLQDIRMGAEALANRLKSIGGSDANIILSESPDRLLRLWKEKRGEQEPEDLSTRLPVMLGCWTETFNRHWYEQITGRTVSGSGTHLVCENHPWRSCTLDGYVEALGAVWEAKHTSAFSKPEEVLDRYMPQLQHNMAVAKAERALLSVIFGNHKWELFEVAADWLYQEDLLAAELRFWECVQLGEAPVLASAPPPPKPVGVREICFQGNNAWAASAADWLESREAARKNAASAAALRELIEADVAKAYGHGIEAKRSKSGAVTIRELAK